MGGYRWKRNARGEEQSQLVYLFLYFLLRILGLLHQLQMRIDLPLKFFALQTIAGLFQLAQRFLLGFRLLFVLVDDYIFILEESIVLLA